MGSVNLQKFYPDNGTAIATDVNNNYQAIRGSSQGLNDENVGNESLIHDHFNFDVNIRHADYQSNGYYVSTGTTLAANAQYRSLTDTSVASGATKTNIADKDHEIAHGSTGVTTTQVGAGTKIAVGGKADANNANGIQILAGDVIHVFWNVTAYRFVPDNGTLTNYVCELIDKSSTRSSILNYAFVVYPQFNTQDSLASNTNFTDAGDGSHGFSNDTFRNPSDGVAALGGGGGVADPNSTGLNNLTPFADYRTDHWRWVPIMMGSGGATSGAGDDTVAVMMDAQNGASNNAIGESKNCSGQTYIKVDTNKNLYAIQLYVAGCIGLHYNTTTTKNGSFVEDQAVTNAQGGIDGTLHIERASIGYVIYRKEGV